MEEEDVGCGMCDVIVRIWAFFWVPAHKMGKHSAVLEKKKKMWAIKCDKRQIGPNKSFLKQHIRRVITYYNRSHFFLHLNVSAQLIIMIYESNNTQKSILSCGYR